MSERVWTPEQRQSIEARGGSLLISAAAGSGKTAVLVERIIQLITDSEHPVDVDRLLVVTFTRAAAAEMRQRLSKALAQKMAEKPDDLYYQRQQMLLPRAYISTVHGFCTRLLQEFAGQTGLPVGFRVADESQSGLLAAQALDEVLEENYRRRDPAFMALAAQLNSGRNDMALRTAVKSAYTFMQAQPFPEKWLQERIDDYSAVMPLEQTAWMKTILKALDMELEYAAALCYRAYEVSVAADLEPYLDILLCESQQLTRLRAALATATYDEMQTLVCGFSFERLAPIRAKDDAVVEAKEEVKALRDAAKKSLARCAGMFCGTEAECRADLAQMAPLVDALGALVRQFTERYVALKRQEKLLDYNDLEHESLRLLLDDDGNPTPLAEELSRRFAHIMVDEYQDTNAAQEELFKAISRKEENLFFVGDVKQSIYGFRQAMPFLFTRRRGDYSAYHEEKPTYPATITLKNNFRSRRTVTDTVNFLFRQLMSERLGGVVYGDDEELKYSASYEEAETSTEWLLLDKAAAAAEGITDVQAEARLIAQRIRQMKEAGMKITDGKKMRTVEYGDFCILLRGRTHIAEYVKELARLGIPAAADKGADFLSTPEVQAALSLLRVIDNPLREVELTAVMLSPLFGFTADDLALLRVTYGKYLPLYVAVEKMSKEDNADLADLSVRCGLMLTHLRRLRTLAVSLPADRLLETVYRELDVEAVFAARSGGRQRVANLHQLDRIARGFEQGGFRGLSAFVRHLDRLQEQGVDLGGGDTLCQSGVRLMTVHASKGLEFPVVFLARLGGQGSNEDSRKKLLFHHSLGIGMKLTDNAEGEKHVPLPHCAVKTARQLDDCAEELRVWYVALTRAREKLVMVYSARDPYTVIRKAEMNLPTAGSLLPAVVCQAKSPGEMLLTAALRHPNFRPFRYRSEVASLSAETAWRVELHDNVASPTVGQAEDAAQADPDLVATLRQRLGYTYPYAPLLSVPAHLPASRLSHQRLSRQFIAANPPAFLQKEGMTAAQKGTATHSFMQYADYAAAASDPMAEAQRLLAAGFLTAQQVEVLSEEKLRRFFESSIYRRMTVADELWREFPFVMEVPASMLSPDLSADMAGETVVVQGIADCVFREGDRLILVDYKTDKVDTAAELIDRYRSQMQFYEQALETIFGLPVSETLLYSFALGEAVEVE